MVRPVGSTSTLLTSTSRTARCGPACRVVWQGRGQMAASYADFQTPKRNQKALPHHSVPRCGSACPLSGIAPWVAAMGHPWPSAAKPASCRFTHCAMPAFGHRGLTGRPNLKPKRGGLTADLTFADTLNPLWERACSRWSSTITRPVWMNALSGRSSRAGSLPQLDRGQTCNQVGCQAASLLLWLLIFLPPREAEWRFCAVGKPAWMPV